MAAMPLPAARRTPAGNEQAEAATSRARISARNSSWLARAPGRRRRRLHPCASVRVALPCWSGVAVRRAAGGNL